MSCDPPNRAPRPASAWRPIVAARWGQIDVLRWSIAALVIGLAVWGLTDVRRRGRLDPQHPEVHRTDFTVYTIAGQTMLYGGDPYTVSNPRGWKYLYPPLFALLVAPLADLDPEIQVTVWFAISVLLGWGCLRECVRIARVALPSEPLRGPFGPIPTWIGAAAVTAAAVPALNCLQRGQIGIAVLYFLLLGFRLLVQCQNISQAFLAGVVLTLPVVFKATPLLPVAVRLHSRLSPRGFRRAEFQGSSVPARIWRAPHSACCCFYCSSPHWSSAGNQICITSTPGGTLLRNRKKAH